MGKSVSKIDWVAMQKRSMIQPFRISGVILVALLITAIAYSPKLLETAMVSNIIKQQLSKANGATVDFDSIQLDLSDAKLEINGLGATNPLDLNRNRFYAKTMSASLDLTGIMTKQLVLDNVVINGVSLDMKRSSKGELYRSSLSMTESKDTASMLNNINDVSKNAASFNKLDIEKYKNHAETAKKVANGAKKLVETLSDFSGSSSDTINNEEQPTSDIVNQAKVYGYANVRAENIQIEKPMLTVLNLIIKDYEDFGGKYNILATNISTNPNLLNKSTTIEVKSVDNDDVDINILMSNNADTQNNLSFDVKNLGKNFVEGLNVGGVVLNASSANITGNGQWNFKGADNANFNLPITIELKDVSASFNGIKQNVGKMTLKGVLSGDINNPDLNMDATSLDKMFDVNEVAGNLLNKAGVQGNTKDILKNTKINGKTINDMNSDDIRNVASSFGVKF
jgi:hypothetical protein